MSGVAINLGSSVGCHSESGVVPLSTADNSKNAEPSILASLSDRHRMTKAGISFGVLSMIERKQFYMEAVDEVLSCPTGNLSAAEAARKVALVYGITIADCDSAKIKVTVYSRLRAARAMNEFVVDVPIEPSAIVATANNGHEARGAKRRRAGAESAKTKFKARGDDDGMLPSSKLHRPFKGASSHLDYQEALKDEASAAALRFRAAQETAAVGETQSFNNAVTGMRAALEARGVEVCQSTCWTYLQTTIDNNYQGVSPQKQGGTALPSYLEKRVANVVRNFRGKKFPVFREEVLNWAAEAIKDTEYASYFVGVV